MRYGIIADIHSNLPALKTVLRCLVDDEKVEGIICCGDVVGYAAEPNACVDIIRTIPVCRTVMGNHDSAAAGMMSMDLFNPMAQEAVTWTAAHLMENNRRWLRRLGKTLDYKKFAVVHGSPRDPVEGYIFDIDVFGENLPFMKKDIYFAGHTHVAMYFSAPREGAGGKGEEKIESALFEDGQTLVMDGARKYLINCGSVGQPRDRDPRASAGIYDDEKNVFRIRRIEYDIAGTQKGIEEAGLPMFLAQRLEYGQ